MNALLLSVAQIKKEEPETEPCKAEPMEASTEETREDKKPEIKCEPKEEKEGKETANDSAAGTESKKKSRRRHAPHAPHSLKRCLLFHKTYLKRKPQTSTLDVWRDSRFVVRRVFNTATFSATLWGFCTV